jgi:hypothetical protein
VPSSRVAYRELTTCAMDQKEALSDHAKRSGGAPRRMTEGRPDPDRVQTVGVSVFELRAGIRVRDAVPQPPGLPLRMARKARRALVASIAMSRRFLARTMPVVRTSGALLFRRCLAGIVALDRDLRTMRHRGQPEPPDAPSEEPTPEVDDGDHDDPTLRQALLRLATREYAHGADHPNVASELHFIGALHHEAGRYDEALAYYGLALAIRERTLSADHPELAATLEDLAATRQAQGEDAEGERLLARAQGLRLRYRRPNAVRASTQ